MCAGHLTYRGANMRQRLSYANVIATIALFFALTGGAAAAVKYISPTDPIPSSSDLSGTYGSPQIGAGKVTSAKIASSAITSAKFDPLAVAPDAAKLGGLAPSFFAGAGSSYTKSESDGRYLGITAQAADSAKLDGLDASAFAGVGSSYSKAESDGLFLGINAQAADSAMLDGKPSTDFAQGVSQVTGPAVDLVGGAPAGTEILSKELAPGSYLAIFKGEATAPAGHAVLCNMQSPPAADGSFVKNPSTEAAIQAPLTLLLAFAVPSGGEDFQVFCVDAGGAGATSRISELNLEFLRVGAVAP